MTTFRRFRDAGADFHLFLPLAPDFTRQLWIFGNAWSNGYRLCGINGFKPFPHASSGAIICYKLSQMC